eukprot:3891402-Pyramimonas_sp.AAC.1
MFLSLKKTSCDDPGSPGSSWDPSNSKPIGPRKRLLPRGAAPSVPAMGKRGAPTAVKEEDPKQIKLPPALAKIKTESNGDAATMTAMLTSM